MPKAAPSRRKLKVEDNYESLEDKTIVATLMAAKDKEEEQEDGKSRPTSSNKRKKWSSPATTFKMKQEHDDDEENDCTDDDDEDYEIQDCEGDDEDDELEEDYIEEESCVVPKRQKSSSTRTAMKREPNKKEPNDNATTASTHPLLSFQGSQLNPKQKETARVLLKILRQYVTEFGMHELPVWLVAKSCGYTNTETKAYRVVPAFLRSQKLVCTQTGGVMSLTERGSMVAASLGQVDNAPKSNQDFQVRLAQILGTHEAKIIRVLGTGHELLRKPLAQECGYSNSDSKTFRTAFNKLKELGVLRINGKVATAKTIVSKDARIALADFCFPDGGRPV